MRLPKSISKVQLSDYMAYPCNTDLLPSTALQRVISYNSNGSPTEIVDRHGVHTSIVWGYGGMYPIIIAYGIDLATLNIQGDIQESLNGQQLGTLFDNTPCKIDVYEYEPLVRLTRHYTDKHRYAQYEYDIYGRLIRVLDNEGKQLE
jgi:YD repeat-containing protein